MESLVERLLSRRQKLQREYLDQINLHIIRESNLELLVHVERAPSLRQLLLVPRSLKPLEMRTGFPKTLHTSEAAQPSRLLNP